jgi:hypothetical protein
VYSTSSTTKTGRLDIAEIWLKVAFNIQVEIKDTIDRARSASCLSIRHENDSEGPLKHYDISDDFNFDFVSFPFIHSCIPGTY